MDNRIIDVLTDIRDLYGDGIFYNHTKTKNLLHDLSPQLTKERIQAAHFLEMNGYFQLKYAGRTYHLVRERLIKNYANTYAVSESTAAWVVDVFGALLGYNEIKTGAQYIREQRYAATPVRLETQDSATTPPLPVSADNDADAFNIGGAALAYAANETPLTGGAEWVRQTGLNPALDYTARISADYHSVAVTRDGRVLAAGPNDDGQCNTFAWRDMVAVSAGLFFTVGLRADGTVVACGRNDYGQCNIRHWRDIIAVSAGARHTVGLRADGTVVAAGQNKSGECNVYNWRNIIRVIAGYQCTFGIKKDRRVLVKGNNKAGDVTVSHLNGVADIVNAAPGRALALLTNGTVARVGRVDYMQKNFAAWKDIRQIAAAPDYIAGLRANGTIKLAYFWEDSGVECNTDDWRGIAAVIAGRFHVLGLKPDGTLAAAMMHPDYSLNKGQCNVSNWEV